MPHIQHTFNISIPLLILMLSSFLSLHLLRHFDERPAPALSSHIPLHCTGYIHPVPVLHGNLPITHTHTHTHWQSSQNFQFQCQCRSQSRMPSSLYESQWVGVYIQTKLTHLSSSLSLCRSNVSSCSIHTRFIVKETDLALGGSSL